MNPILLSLLQEQLQGIAEEMGSALVRSAFSPNIRVRKDFSCALFTAKGELLAQAAHIPVHLGSMPTQVRRLVESRALNRGELYLGNDPYDGGTHLPDLTLLLPVFCCESKILLGIAAVRAHHADVGGPVPGSMGSQRDIYGEGIRLPLVRLAVNDSWDPDICAILWANMRSSSDREGDLLAQFAACRVGADGLRRAFKNWADGQLERWIEGQKALFKVSARLTMAGLRKVLPLRESAVFSDTLECGRCQSAVVSEVKLEEDGLTVNFLGTGAGVEASFNAPLAVTQAALIYVVSCLLDGEVAINEGMLGCVKLCAPAGCLVNARPPAAVAAGNVETSQRIVDVLLGALAGLAPQVVPAASAGSMNNLSFGFAKSGVHYETSGGGCGGHPRGRGACGLQVHMTNTLATPIEVLETEFPLLVHSYALRSGSGGRGLHDGGDGTIKRIELKEQTVLTLMATRRTTRPYGLEGGEPGQPGFQRIKLPSCEWEDRPGIFSECLPAGTIFCLATPGGGGWGSFLEPFASSS